MLADARARGLRRARDRQRPRSALGDALARGPRDAAEPDTLRALRDRRRAPLRRAGRLLVGLERAEPSAASSRRSTSHGRAVLAAACTGSCSAPPARGSSAPGNERDRVLMGETAPRGNSNVVAPLAFVRGSLCLTSTYRKRRGCGSLDVDGWAHHPYTTSKGPWFVSRQPRRRHDRVAVAADAGAGQGAARPRRAQARRPLPDRVRGPERARPDQRRQRGRARPSTARSAS